MAVVWLLSHVWPLDYSLWDFPDKNTGVGFHFLIQGIFLTHGLEVSYLKQSRWCWSDNQQSIWIWLSELTKLFLYVAASSLLSIKDLPQWSPVARCEGQLTFGQTSCPSPPQLLTSEIRQNLLSTSLACLLAFEQRAARLTPSFSHIYVCVCVCI